MPDITTPSQRTSRSPASREDGAASEGRGLLTVVVLILIGWALHALASVMVPIAFALIIALILAPVDRSIATHMPRRLRGLGRVAVMTVLLLTLGLFAMGLVYCAEQLLAQIPSTDDLDDMLSSRLPELFGNGSVEQDSPLPSWLVDAAYRSGDAITGWVAGTTGSVLSRVAGASGTLVAGTILIVFMVLLVLSETETWQAKATRLWGSRSTPAVRSAVGATAVKLRRWLLVRSAMGVFSAAAYTAWLAVFGVDLLMVWALLVFLLVFIPNIGALISGVLPTAYALLTKDFNTALWVGVGLFAIEQIIGNWIDPRFQGQQIAVSPVVVFVALLVWSWIWGVAGAFLATPMTVVIMVVCLHIEAARPVALLLSNQPDLDKLDAKVRN